MAESIQLLLIDGSSDQYWPEVLKEAIESVGTLQIVTEADAFDVLRGGNYALTVVDAAAVRDVSSMVAQLIEQQPRMKIIVATASPTWIMAREVFQSGAIDYMRKSINPDDIRSTIQGALAKGIPSWTGA